MNRHADNLRAQKWDRTRRDSLAKARCVWAALMAVLICGMLYFCDRAAQLLAWWIDGSERAGWSAILWAVPFLLFAGMAFFTAIEWPDADEYDPEK